MTGETNAKCEICGLLMPDGEQMFKFHGHSGPCPGPPLKKRHPAIAGVLQFFAYAHLPANLQEVSKPFCELAETVADGPANAESTVALRKLLEAKDAAVRAVLFKA